MPELTHRILRAICVLACTALAACAVAPPDVSTAPTPAEEAQRLQASGQLQAAARLWEQAAGQAVSPAQDRYRLRAAEAWLAAGDDRAAAGQLSLLDQQRLAADERSRFALLSAELALLRADGDSAAFYLEIAREGLPAKQRQRYLQLEDSVLRLRADPTSNLLGRIAVALGTTRQSDPADGGRLLLELERVSSGLLERAVYDAPEGSIAGSWADLALRVRRSLVSGEDGSRAATQWANDYPEHAVTRQGFQALAHGYGSRFLAPERVAVLLPLQGSLSAAGLAIRDGLLGAYLRNPGRSSLKFYDSGDTPAAALRAYEQSRADGAQWVIGPVSRDSVASLANSPARSLPALVLNETEPGTVDAASAKLYSLSLSQEEEARTVARKMAQNGISRVILLATASAWGQRMEQAFTDAFEQTGGVIIERARVPASESDHTELLTRVLQIDQSMARMERLQSLLGQTLIFEPHHRDDFDAVFLAADPEQARQLRPQLRFFEVGDKPVFAMSRVFSGAPDRIADHDLNGIILPLTRTQMSAVDTRSLPDLASTRGGSLTSLYALGADAWNVLPWLPLLSIDRDLEFRGAVGNLRAGDGGQLVRDPAWAIFAGGQPAALQWPVTAQ
jgi:outer membrane PBP1 activator LpoA protein